MTDFRARGTIMGPTGLTAVFGMGTGVTPPVWSPEKPPAGGQAAPVAFVQSNPVVDHAGKTTVATRSGWRTSSPRVDPHGRGIVKARGSCGAIAPVRAIDLGDLTAIGPTRRLGHGGRIGVVKHSAVGTGPLRRSPAVHSQPIDLVVFQEPSQHSLPETSS